MERFTTHTGTALPLRRSNVDTDQIIPAEYLKRITRHGYEDALFRAWRADPDFVLNNPAYAGATILVAGPEFGTGSSREHAVWALLDYGFRVVIASRFADIFRGNAGKGGLLTVECDQAVIDDLWSLVEAEPTTRISVDLPAQTIIAGDDEAVRTSFAIDSYVKWRLVEGLDDIGLTLRHLDAIADFELRRPAFLPTTQGS